MKRFYQITLTCLLAFLFITPNSIAQKKDLSMEDAVVGMWRQYYPEYRRNMQWHGDSKHITFVSSEGLMQESIASDKSKCILNLETLNEILDASEIPAASHFPSVKWVNSNTISLNTNNNYIEINLKDKAVIKIIKLPEAAENTEITPDKQAIAFTTGKNLAYANTEALNQVTNNRDQNLTAGQTIARNEFGIDKGIFWSPDSKKMAYYLKDESMVTDYPLVDIRSRVATVDNIKYPMAGMKSEESKLIVLNTETNSEIVIQTTGDPEQYLTNISWTPDSKQILIAVLNRAQNHMQMNLYQAETGEFIRTVFEERHDKYVEPQHPAKFIPGSTSDFIWQSRRDGYNHLYRYTTKGELKKQLTSGNWEVTELIGFTPKSNDIIFQSTAASPIERHIYKLNLSTNEITQLTNAAGVHSASLSPNGEYILDNYSSTEMPNAYDIINLDGKFKRNILTAENPLSDINIGEVEIGTIKAADGETDLYYRLILPPNFDPNALYPTVVYVYGGPHAQLITNSWLGGARGWQYLMAQKGYVMFTLDNRGSANRGADFENIIHRKLGEHEMADQMQGIEFLKSKDYVDAERIGIHGWSFGGFMTTNLMLNHPDVFKVGVAGGTVVDWKYYEVMYGERYMDTPDENPEGYEANNLAKQCKKLEGKLMMIHGGIDPVVVQQHSFVFVRECIKNQIPIDYFVYPRAEHNVGGYDRIHLMQKVTDYFDDHLK
ncbi:MAG: DPP IV N-terminal domain-containing protein [Bacteroidales bacterium]|nr:DPP IV N-terminal domain-containing protein [Bacteroidales bacterium]